MRFLLQALRPRQASGALTIHIALDRRGKDTVGSVERTPSPVDVREQTRTREQASESTHEYTPL